MENEERGPSLNPLARKSILCYGTGHMLNDVTASCWFTYLLIFLTNVGLSPREAATVMLSGQFADGAATIFVGQLIDAFGHFKLWLAGGSLLVALSFSSVFGGCPACKVIGSNSLLTQTIGYSFFAAVFNMGWAAAQISHMSLVNCITANQNSRVALNSCRNAFTMVANLLLFGVAYVVFKLVPANDAYDVQNQFRWIAGVSIGLGSLFVLIFLLGVKEPRLYHHLQPKDISGITYSMWFKKILYYQVAFVYTFTRLSTNVSQALLAFYLVDDLDMAPTSKAVVPAIIYISSFFASICLQELHWTSYRLKAFFTAGAFMWILAGVAILRMPSSPRISIYLLAATIGIGNAFMLVTATSMEGVLVGNNLDGCAFVYGSLSLCDKLSCGIALFAIEAFHVKSRPRVCSSLQFNIVCEPSLVRKILAFVPGGCALFGAIITNCMDLEPNPVTLTCLSEPLLPQQEQYQGIPRHHIRTLHPVKNPTSIHHAPTCCIHIYQSACHENV